MAGRDGRDRGGWGSSPPRRGSRGQQGQQGLAGVELQEAPLSPFGGQ